MSIINENRNDSILLFNKNKQWYVYKNLFVLESFVKPNLHVPSLSYMKNWVGKYYYYDNILMFEKVWTYKDKILTSVFMLHLG